MAHGIKREKNAQVLEQFTAVDLHAKVTPLDTYHLQVCHTSGFWSWTICSTCSMARAGNGPTLLQNPVRTPIFTPVRLVQVFNSGKPCGWLGRSKNSYWFHYGSSNPQHNWVSLLTPPSQNFYQQTELLPVFTQHLPSDTSDEATIDSPLAFLHEFNGKQPGALSFANPVNPVVKRPLLAPPPLMPGESALIARQTCKEITDTLCSPWKHVANSTNTANHQEKSRLAKPPASTAMDPEG